MRDHHSRNSPLLVRANNDTTVSATTQCGLPADELSEEAAMASQGFPEAANTTEQLQLANRPSLVPNIVLSPCSSTEVVTTLRDSSRISTYPVIPGIVSPAHQDRLHPLGAPTPGFNLPPLEGTSEVPYIVTKVNHSLGTTVKPSNDKPVILKSKKTDLIFIRLPNGETYQGTEKEHIDG